MLRNLAIWLIATVAAIGGLLFGFNTGVISGAILFVSSQFHLGSGMQGVVVSAVLFGAVFGSLIGGRFADIFGRKKLLIATAIIFILGSTLTAIASDVAVLIIGRIIVGIAIGICAFVAPLYITEIAPTKIRGALVSIYQLLIAVGIGASYLVDYLTPSNKGWRFMLGIGVFPAVCFLIGMLLLPESPRWMIIHGWADRARKTLKLLHPNENVESEIIFIEDNLRVPAKWRTLFKRWVMPAVIVGFGMAFIQQITGINTIIYYAPTFLEKVGIQTAHTALLITLIIGSVNIIFTIISLFLIDRFGRRPLLLSGIILMIVGTIMVDIVFIIGMTPTTVQTISIISMIIYVIGFAIGLGPITWLIIAEIFPLRIRGLATSLATAINWGANMIVAFSFLPALQIFSEKIVFPVFTLICIAAWVFVYIYIPETKNVTLEQIEINLRTGKSSRYLGSVSK